MLAPAAVVKGGRILVVDDEPMVRDTLGTVLMDEGYVVDVASDGFDALERVRAERPDAILLDLMMPGMNGRQFLQALRDDPRYAQVPVLIMTAVHGLEVNLASIGASEVVEKPFNIEDLLNKLALAVWRSRDADTVPVAMIVPPEPVPEPVDRGIVLVVERDRTRLQRLDLLLSQRGYTVVSMTRARLQLSRLAKALRPRAILLERSSDGLGDILAGLRAEDDPIPTLVFARDGAFATDGVMMRASDVELVEFVDQQTTQLA